MVIILLLVNCMSIVQHLFSIKQIIATMIISEFYILSAVFQLYQDDIRLIVKVICSNNPLTVRNSATGKVGI